MGGIIEISPKGFTLGVKSLKKKNNFFFLIYHFLALTWSQGKKNDKFPIMGLNSMLYFYYFSFFFEVFKKFEYSPIELSKIQFATLVCFFWSSFSLSRYIAPL